MTTATPTTRPLAELRSLHAAQLDARASDFRTGRVVQTISTENLARDGAIIPADSWVLDAYRSNPIVLWMHDAGGRGSDRLPIARCSEIHVDAARRALVATTQFDMGDAFAVEVLRKIEAGLINATSVRWLPIDRPRLEKRKVTNAAGELVEREVVVFPRNELLELSYVTVPADAAALIMRNGDGFVRFAASAYGVGAEAPRSTPSSGSSWRTVKAEADRMLRGAHASATPVPRAHATVRPAVKPRTVASQRTVTYEERQAAIARGRDFHNPAFGARASMLRAFRERSITVEFVERSLLSYRGRRCVGNFWPSRGLVSIAEDLSERGRLFTMAHELGHVVGYREEALADAFATGLTGYTDRPF